MTNKPYIKKFNDNGDYSLTVELTKHGQKTFGCSDYRIVDRSTRSDELATIEWYDLTCGEQIIEYIPGEEFDGVDDTMNSLEELFDHPGDALEYIFARRQELLNPSTTA
ncbi:hypothetical protein O206_11145 [Ochrobactrum sp. EGD-AQ16]|nr:hypothetical protein O206_11145 [Ochrobactrum sp. EGD-AQ16]